MTLIRRILLALSLNVIIILSLGCLSDSDKIYHFSVINPITYTYPYSIDSIKMIIKRNFSHGEFYGLDLATKEDPLITKSFDNPNNMNDFLLEEFSTWHKCISKVYYNNKDEPHIYHASYQIHIEKLDYNHTKVSIIVFESGIIYKTKFPVFPHLNRVNRLKEVKPTTVEEYEILLIIGKGLGVKNMPPIKLPSKIIIN